MLHGCASFATKYRLCKSRLPSVNLRQINKKTVKPGGLSPPVISEMNQVYEIDEMLAFIGRNPSSCYAYITYAINRVTKKVIGFVVGPRTKEMIGKVVQMVLGLSPRRIYTDGLNVYPSLIPEALHRVFRFHTNAIERNNLTIRTHIKRLSRKTICFSKSLLMLAACLRIYFWQG